MLPVLDHSVYSLNPLPGYRAPTLSGHKAAVVGVFFAGVCGGPIAKGSVRIAVRSCHQANDHAGAVAESATLAGVPAPSLISVSKDGAVHTFAHNRTNRADPAASASDIELPSGGSQFSGAHNL